MYYCLLSPAWPGGWESHKSGSGPRPTLAACRACGLAGGICLARRLYKRHWPQKPHRFGKGVAMINHTPTLLLTPKQAAAALAVSPRTLWSLTAPRGPIPAVRLGRLVRYRVEAMADWLAENEKGGPSQ